MTNSYYQTIVLIRKIDQLNCPVFSSADWTWYWKHLALSRHLIGTVNCSLINTHVQNGMELKKCHWCEKRLRSFEIVFTHCCECNVKRLDKMTPDFDPCPVCQKLKVVQN